MHSIFTIILSILMLGTGFCTKCCCKGTDSEKDNKSFSSYSGKTVNLNTGTDDNIKISNSTTTDYNYVESSNSLEESDQVVNNKLELNNFTSEAESSTIEVAQVQPNNDNKLKLNNFTSEAESSTIEVAQVQPNNNNNENTEGNNILDITQSSEDLIDFTNGDFVIVNDNIFNFNNNDLNVDLLPKDGSIDGLMDYAKDIFGMKNLSSNDLVYND